MRVHGGHVLVTTLAAVGVLLLYAAWQRSGEPDVATETVTSGSLPPMDSDASLVPRIEVETTELHVGTIPNAGLFETRLAVYNRGKAPLRLSDVRTNCACSQGRIPESSRVVPPGGEGVIEVMVDPRRIVGFHSRKTLTLFSNDPEQSRVRIDVVADVDPEFEVIPAEVEFGEVEKGEVVSRTVLVRQRQEEPLEITDVAERGRRAGDDGASELQIAWRPRPKEMWEHHEKSEYAIDVTLGADASPGPYLRFFDIKTNVDRVPALPIKVAAEIRAPYTLDPAYPRALAIVGTAASPDATGTVRVTGEAPLTIADVETDLDALRVEVADGDAPNAKLIIASLSPEAAPGRFDGVLRFTVRINGREYWEKVAIRAVVAR